MAISRDCERLSQLLECYEKASGQQLNKENTSILFSCNTSQEDKDCLWENLECRNSKVLRIGCGSGCMIRRQNFYHRLEKKFFLKL